MDSSPQILKLLNKWKQDVQTSALFDKGCFSNSVAYAFDV